MFSNKKAVAVLPTSRYKVKAIWAQCGLHEGEPSAYILASSTLAITCILGY